MNEQIIVELSEFLLVEHTGFLDLMTGTPKVSLMHILVTPLPFTPSQDNQYPGF